MEKQAGFWQVVSERSIQSSNSTPYESALCSPRSSTDRSTFGYYSVNTPACPVKITCDITSLFPSTDMGFVVPSCDESFSDDLSPEDFDFSSRFSETDPPWSSEPMSTADELFCNGRIRPLWYTREDLTPLSSQYANKPDPDDEDTHFDFKSSADYKFSMSSTLHSPASARNTIQRCVECGYNGHSPEECLVVKEDAGEAQRTKGIVQKWKDAYSRQGREEMIAKQATMLKVEESIASRAGGNKEGSVRRTRSLSPLRVFHMDDDLPKHSFESDQCFRLTKGDGGYEGKEEQGTKTTSCKERRLTLKELLHSSSRTEHMPSQQHAGKPQNKARMEMEIKMKKRRAPLVKFSPRHAFGKKLEEDSNDAPHHLPVYQESVSPHGLHYTLQRTHMEQMRQQTFLPYRRGLLGCLGFTSKSYRSVAGIQTFHSKSGGTRRRAGNDTLKSL